jgi:hypothetical protein
VHAVKTGVVVVVGLLTRPGSRIRFCFYEIAFRETPAILGSLEFFCIKGGPSVE